MALAFGTFEFDPSTGELRRQGRRAHLAAQPARALALLVARAGTAVTRDELRRELWGEETFVDFDRGLNFCVAAIRTALGDDARSPRFVETLPKRGYRFIADVRPIAAERAAPAFVPEPAAPANRRWPAAAIAAIAILAQGAALPRAHTRVTARPEARSAFERALASDDASDAGRRRRIATLRSAVRIDPRFAEAHYALADLYLSAAVRRELPVDAALAEARASAERAVALEDAAESRQVLGTVRLLADHDWDGARRELTHALALAPRWDSGLVSYARLLSAAGDDRGAIDAIDRAEALSPSCDLVLFDAGHVYARAGRLDDAIEKYGRAIEVGPPRHMTAGDWQREVAFRMLAIDVTREHWTAAQHDALTIMAANGVSSDARERFASADSRAAVLAFLRNSARGLEARARTARVPAGHGSVLYALLDDADAALGWLERGAAEHDPELTFALRNPEFVRLRSLPRFQHIVADVLSRPSPRR